MRNFIPRSDLCLLARGSIDAKVNKLYKSNLDKTARRLGVNVGEPMSFIKADNGLPNINYNVGEEYKVNCQCCVVSYELRRRGLNVTAVPNYRDGGEPEILSKSTSSIWLDINGNKPAKIKHRNNKQTAKDIKALVESKIREKFFDIKNLEYIGAWFNLVRVDNLRVNLNKIGKVVRKL